MDLSKKNKLYKSMSKALCATVVTAGVSSAGLLASGIVAASDAANQEEQFDQQLKVVELSEGYRQHVKSSIRGAYVMYDKGEISYDEFVAVAKEFKNNSEIEKYAENSVEYSGMVAEHDKNFKKLKSSCAACMFGSSVAASVAALGIAADKHLSKKSSQLQWQIDAKKNREEAEEDTM